MMLVLFSVIEGLNFDAANSNYFLNGLIFTIIAKHVVWLFWFGLDCFYLTTCYIVWFWIIIIISLHRPLKKRDTSSGRPFLLLEVARHHWRWVIDYTKQMEVMREVFLYSNLLYKKKRSWLGLGHVLSLKSFWFLSPYVE